MTAPDWLLGDRPRPTGESLAGAAAGLLLLAGVFALLEELPEDNVRAGGIALGLLTLLVGCVGASLQRSGPVHVAGVALIAGAVAPLAFFVVNDPLEVDSETDVLVAVVVAVVAWVAFFVVGPVRGHCLLLGLALFGLWSGALTQTGPAALAFPFGSWIGVDRTIDAEPVPVPELPPQTISIPEIPNPTFTIPTFPQSAPPPSPEPQPPLTFPPFEPPAPPTFAPPSQSQEQSQRHSRAQSDGLGRVELVAAQEDKEPSEPAEPDKPPVAPSIVSLVVGALYLAGALALDSFGLRRPAAATLAVGIPAAVLGAAFLAPRYGAVTAGLTVLAVGVAMVALGAFSGRRFTAWVGVFVATSGVAVLVEDWWGDPGAGAAVGLLLAGGAVLGAAWFLTPQPPAPAAPATSPPPDPPG